MKYIVIFEGETPFRTKWINSENFDGKCLVIDTSNNTWSKDGENWHEMEEDHL